MSTECMNCGATIPDAATRCPVCGFDGSDIRTAVVPFRDDAREASDGLGGLLDIIPVEAGRVAYIARCVGGVFALDRAGTLVWRFDADYVTTLEIVGRRIIVNGVVRDIETGLIAW